MSTVDGANRVLAAVGPGLRADAMQVSPVGFLVFIVLLAVVYAIRGSTISGLLAALAFATTAVVTLTSLGGSSPLIYVLFAALFVGTTPLRRTFWQDFNWVSAKVRVTWVVYGLLAYVVIGSWLFPRLFAGRVSVFVASREKNGVFEVPLLPVSGNVTQTAYFVLGGLIFVALCVLLTRRERFEDVCRGFLMLSIVHAAGGLIDFAGKMAGMGDVLAPLRTASYEMLTNVEQAGFARIVGLCSEASTFGSISLACLAFTYIYWRETGSRPVFLLSMVLLFLVVASTSTTAYVGFLLLCIPVAFSTARSFLANRTRAEDVLIVGLFLVIATALMAIVIYSHQISASFGHLIDQTIIDKTASESGRERAYWNYKSLQAFADTYGLGVGMGSSRASSWPIAVISQLGMVGAVILAGLLAFILTGLGKMRPHVDPRTRAIVASARACSLAALLSASISGGSADPGVIFFTALAVVTMARAKAAQVTPRDQFVATNPSSDVPRSYAPA